MDLRVSATGKARGMTKKRSEWTYRVAFAHQLVDFTVGMGSSGGCQSDCLFLCGTSRHCGRDLGKIEGIIQGARQTKGYKQKFLLFFFIPRALWWTRERMRGGEKNDVVGGKGNWRGRKKERADGDGVLTDGSQKLGGDGDCHLLTGKGFGLHGLTD